MAPLLLEYRLTLYAPRSVDPTEATILTPPGGAVHADAFKVTTMNTLAGWKPYLGYPRGRTGRMNMLERTTDVGSMSFDINDAALTPGVNSDRWVSAFLGNSNGDPQLGGIKCFVEESLDGGATWAAYFTGYVKSIALDMRRGYTVTVRDMTYELTKLPLFNQQPHSSISYVAKPLLMPLGVSAAYGTQPATADLTGKVVSPVVVGGSTLANVATVALDHASIIRKDNFVTQNLLSSVAPDIKKNLVNTPLPFPLAVLPNFKGPCRAHLTWNAGANQGDFLVGHLGLTPYGGVGNWISLFAGLGHAGVASFMIQPLDTTDLNYSALPANGTTVSIRLFADAKMEDGAALLIDVANPLTFLADILNGKFGPIWRFPEAPPPGKVYGDAHRVFTHTISSASQPELAPYRNVIDKPVDNALEFIQKELLKPYGLTLVCNASGSFSVVDMRLPTSLGGFATITDADVVVGRAPDWEFDRDSAVYRTETILWEDFILQLDELKGLPDKYPTFSKLLLTSVDHPQIQLGVGAADFGDKVWKMEGNGYRVMDGDPTINNMSRTEYMQGKIKEQQDLIRRPFAHGGTYITLPVRRTAVVAGLVQGQAVLVNVSTLPNPSTGKRGGVRVCRVVELTRNGLEGTIRLLDLGTATTPSGPTVGAPALGSDPRHTATCLITLNSGIPAEVRFALTNGGSAPGNTDPAWRYWEGSPIFSTQTITITGLTPGMRLWVQARSMPFPFHGVLDQMPSAWVTSASLDLTSYPSPSAVTITNVTARGALVSWTNGATDLLVEIGLRSPDSGAYTRVATLLPGSTSYQLLNLVPSTAYGVSVQYTSMHGMLSGVATNSFTTSSADILYWFRPPPPIRIYA